MSAEILKFPEPTVSEGVWCCDECGATLFRLHSDGSIECVKCDGFFDEVSWSHRFDGAG